MEKNLPLSLRSCALTLLAFAATFSWSQAPTPDVYYTFDESEGTQITDSSGNQNHGFWYNYNGEDPGIAERTGWRPGEGYRGGAGYLAGDHSDCVNPCSSGSDLLLFANSSDAECMGNMPENQVFKMGYESATIAFWFKNDWNYLCDPSDPPHQCFSDEGDCAWERQVLWSSGDGNTGITMEIYPGALYPALIKVSINDSTTGNTKSVNAFYEPVSNKEWVHFAIVFEGDSAAKTGTLKLYCDTMEVASVATPFGYVFEESSAVVFGAENGNSVSGFNVGECWGEVYDLCGITAEEVGRLRFGWPARGWIDELGYWHNKALTKEQITEVAKMRTSVGIQKGKSYPLSVYPSPASDYIRIAGLTSSDSDKSVRIYNIMGQLVLWVDKVEDNQRIDLPADLSQGVYILVLEENGLDVAIKDFIIQR